MNKFLWQGLLVTVVFFISQTVVVANTFNGTISLPPGIVADIDGVTIELRGFLPEFLTGRDTVVIPQGQNSVNYTLFFQADNDRIIEFECTVGCVELGITSEGQWSDVEGIVDRPFGTVYSGSSDHVVDIILEQATIFSGVVNFPSNFVANDETIFVSIRSNDQFSLVNYSIVEFIEPGQTEVSFAIGVPSDLTSTSWQLTAFCFDSDNDDIDSCPETLIDGDNFATTVNGNPLSLEEDDAFEFPTGGSYTALELTLIGPDIEEPVEPGDTGAFMVPQVILLLEDE